MHSTQAQSSFTPVLTGLDTRYELKELVARNGSSLVYRARDKVLDREVAIKTIQTQRFDQKQIMRFQAEAKTVSTLRHESLVRVLDFGVTQTSQPYLVFDFVNGTTLQGFVQKHGPLPLEKTFSIITQVCLAISHAHSHGVIHRDVKSSNIMLTMPSNENVLAKVIDFGIAVVLEDSSRGVTLTPTGVIVGSPAYMSPEQIQQQGADERSDIYSLGCVLYEAITGRVPFVGDSALEILHRHVHAARPKVNVKKFPEGIGEALNELFTKALHVDRDERHQTIYEFHDHILEIWDKLESLRKTPASPVLECLAISGNHGLSSQRDSQVMHLEPNSKRFNPLVIALVLSVILLVLTIFATIIDTRPLSAVPEKPVDVAYAGSALEKHLQQKVERDDIHKFFKENVDNLVDSEEIHPLDQKLADLHGTVDLDLKCNDLSRVNLVPLTRLPLESLEVPVTNLTSKGLIQLCEIQTLKVLDISKNLDLSVDSFKHLKNLKNLRFLSATSCGLSDEHVLELSQCKSLVEVHLSLNSRLTHRSIQALSMMPNLETLHITGCRLKPEDLAALSRSRHLNDLKLDGMKIDDKNITPICELKELRRLSLNYTDVTSVGLKPLLSSLDQLEDLSLYGCKNIDEKDVMNLKSVFPGCDLTERQTMF